MLEALVSAQPDAIAVALHLAAAFARPPARPVALVFRALGFRTEKRNIRQRAITAVLALEQGRLAQMLQRAQHPGTLQRVSRVRANFRAPFGKGRAGLEQRLVRPLDS